MPYRIDIHNPPADALDRLIEMGALDVEPIANGIAAILPDSVNEASVVSTLGVSSITISPAVARDSGSVWLLTPRAVRVGRILIASTESETAPASLTLIDSAAFGTGHHPTTALCIEALEQILAGKHFDSMLDVGTGSGILALAALALGVPRAVGLDIDAEALEAAARNAQLNHLEDRLQLVRGGPEALDSQWPLVMANVLAAPLIEMAPVLVRRLAKSGQLILSGISSSLESEVRSAYQRCGMRHIVSRQRSGWTALIAQAPW